MNTLRNCHSPAGMGYSTYGCRLTNLTDCPACKYGTLDKQVKDGVEFFKCADCGKEFPPKQQTNNEKPDIPTATG